MPGQAPRPVARLQVVGWVPVWIDEHDSVCAGQVDPEPPRSRGEEEEEDGVVGIVAVDKGESARDGSVAVETLVLVVCGRKGSRVPRAQFRGVAWLSLGRGGEESAPARSVPRS